MKKTKRIAREDYILSILSENPNGTLIDTLFKRLKLARLNSVYEKLNAFQKQGLVEKVQQNHLRVDGRPPNYFRLTEKGREVVTERSLGWMSKYKTYIELAQSIK